MRRTDLLPHGQPIWLSIISARRPHSVARMRGLVGDATWYVDAESYDDYPDDANTMIGGTLCESRNFALREAFDRGMPCVQLSDDLTSIKMHTLGWPRRWRYTRDVDFAELITELHDITIGVGAKLGGVNPAGNVFFASESHPIRTEHFVLGDCMLILPSAPRFDENLTLKEDYDFTLQHLRTYGCVTRGDYLLPIFTHRTNDGGAVSYRTPDEEERNIAYLANKWPRNIVRRSAKPTEVRLRWP